jgi:secondary thiamine-phosphate synthase enzyme
VAQQYLLTLPSYKKGLHLITNHVIKVLPHLPQAGLLHVFIQHTSAGLTINENADPTVRHDMDKSFDQLAPENEPYYLHTTEGSDDMPAHIKAALIGSSVSIPITNGKLNLGTWQGIYLCEFREQPSDRNLVLTLIS